MKPFYAAALCAAVLFAPLAADRATAQTPSLTEKLNAYIGCINRLSERSYKSRSRYFSWADKKGPTGDERIIYGTYTIYDTSDCKKNVKKANAMEPHDAALEAAASAYAEAVGKLEPLLKEADDYYSSRTTRTTGWRRARPCTPVSSPRGMRSPAPTRQLRGAVDTINDRRAAEKLAEIERSEGRKSRYYVQALMIQAKRVMRTEETEKPDLAAITQALNDYEGTIKAAEQFSGAGGDAKIGSMFIGNAKSFLITAKQLMRRIRDKVPYSSGDKMMLNNAGSGWMVEGSPPRLLRDYNQLVDSYNRGANI